MIHAALFSVAQNAARYEVDGVYLGERIAAVISERGVPESSDRTAFSWTGKSGEKLTVRTTAGGNVDLIDLVARPGQKRTIRVPGQLVVLGETGHVNYTQPDQADLDGICGAGLLGEPCEVYRLNRDTDLVMNFGVNTGNSDWALSEVILADRNVLIDTGRIIAK